jgi:hypothetical protein
LKVVFQGFEYCVPGNHQRAHLVFGDHFEGHPTSREEGETAQGLG